MKVRTYFSRARASTVVFVLFFAVAVKSPSENAFAANVFVSSSADITNALATAHPTLFLHPPISQPIQPSQRPQATMVSSDGKSAVPLQSLLSM
jgi:hypothetical protein